MFWGLPAMKNNKLPLPRYHATERTSRHTQPVGAGYTFERTLDLINNLNTDSLLPIKDCDACFYRQALNQEGGHCYMFKEDFDSDHCGQFKPLPG